MTTLMGTMAETLNGLTRECIIELVFFILALVIGWLLARKLSLRWRSVAYAVLSILTIRLVLVGNPVSWMIYERVLTAGDVGWRQRDVIEYENMKYVKRPAGIKYLAVGSSQAEAIYIHYAKKHNNFELVKLAGMGPLDFVLYRDYIASFKAKYVLLYLSEFDIARRPSFTAAKIGPAQRGYYLKLLWKIRSLSGWDVSDNVLVEMLVGEFFPEYKYSFVFRGLINKLFNEREALGKKDITRISSEERLRRNLKNIRENVREEGTDFNMAFLEEFVKFCTGQNVRVVLVEGQYNPVLCSEKTRRLNRIVHRELAQLADKHENAFFLGRQIILEFKQEDYRDGYHIIAEPARAFCLQLMDYLEANFP